MTIKRARILSRYFYCTCLSNVITKGILLLLFLFGSQSVRAQDFYVVNDVGEVYYINAGNCSSVLVGSNALWTDIAVCPGNPNLIYGVDFAGWIYTMDTQTGQINVLNNTFAANFPGYNGINSMVCDGNGTLYVADIANAVFSYNIASSAWSYVGNPGAGSSGDLTFFNGSLYLAAMGGSIVQMSLNPFTVLSVTQFTGAVLDALGIITVIVPGFCTPVNTQMLAFWATGSYDVDVNSGLTTVVCPNLVPSGSFIYGAASVSEGNNPSPNALNVICNDTNLCVGDSATLTAFSAGVNGISYLWQPGSFSGSTLTVTPVTNTTYTVIGTDANGCQDTVMQNIYVQPTPLVNLGSDTALCNVAAYTLNAQNSGTTYLWSTGATSQTIQVNTSGIYWVEVSNGVCTNEDTVQITIVTLATSLVDTASCSGTPLILNAQNTGAQYLWNTGDTTQTIPVNASGWYAVNIIKGSCNIIDSALVSILPSPVALLDDSVTLCNGTSVLLDAGNTGADFLWSTGATTQQITVVTPGLYSVTVTDSACSVIDSALVELSPQPTLPDAIKMCDLQSLELNSGISGAISYLWSDGSQTQTIYPAEPGLYWVEINYETCLLYDSTRVDGNIGGGTVWIPNAFSPDKNGLNETFCVVGTDLQEMHLMIYNRWGELIFETTKPYECWDGTFKDQPVQKDVYIWKLEYSTACGQGKWEYKIGHVVLVR